MTETTQKELDFLDWTKRLSDIIRIGHLCISDGRTMGKRAYEVLEKLHGVWWEGEIPLYKTVLDVKDDVSVQSDLFTAKTAENNKK